MTSIHCRIQINEYWTKNFLPVLTLSDFWAQVVTSVVTAKKHLTKLYVFSKSWPSTFHTRLPIFFLSIKTWMQKLNQYNLCSKLTARQVGPTCEVRFCLTGPPDLNSSLGVICQNPTGGAIEIHPWTLRLLFSQEYWYLSSTCTINIKPKEWYKKNSTW